MKGTPGRGATVMTAGNDDLRILSMDCEMAT